MLVSTGYGAAVEMLFDGSHVSKRSQMLTGFLSSRNVWKASEEASPGCLFKLWTAVGLPAESLSLESAFFPRLGL